MTGVDLWRVERECRADGFRLICGADEAGAGPLAGDVYAAAVILPDGFMPDGLNDSKQVSPKNRERLFQVIQEKSVAWAVASVDPAVIDEINILAARLLAMDRAIRALIPAPDFALIDGNCGKGISCRHRTIVKGDSISANIAAASILAKVSRDRYMEEMARRYPQYEFERHKGYPTKRHYELLRQYGPSPIHRKSFLKKFYAEESGWGEAVAAEDLRRKGWRLVAAGWQCRFGEIDLIAENSKYITFIEVKLRKNADFAPARAAVDRRKQERLRTSAELYLSQHPTDLQPRFDVAEVYAPDGIATRAPEIIYIEDAF